MNSEFFDKRFPFVMDSLRNARRTGRLAHAHLVVSANPDFRHDFPILLAMFAACQTPLENGSPCGVCETCRLLSNGTYPDIFNLSPASKSRQIRVGDDDSMPNTLRWFEKQLQLTSMTASGWKIGIVQDADRLNENAQNAFLKTLEEPLPRCLLILVTGRPSELLPTILSRCQALHLTDNKCVYRFPRCADVPEILMKLQFHAQGDMLKANDCTDSLLDIASSMKDLAEEEVDAKWNPIIEKVKNQTESDAFERWKNSTEETIVAEQSARYRDMREQFISMIHAWFAQASLLADGSPKELLPNPEIMEPLLREQPAIQPRFAASRLALAEGLASSLRTNVNDELALRAFCLNVALKPAT